MTMRDCIQSLNIAGGSGSLMLDLANQSLEVLGVDTPQAPGLQFWVAWVYLERDDPERALQAVRRGLRSPLRLTSETRSGGTA